MQIQVSLAVAWYWLVQSSTGTVGSRSEEGRRKSEVQGVRLVPVYGTTCRWKTLAPNTSAARTFEDDTINVMYMRNAFAQAVLAELYAVPRPIPTPMLAAFLTFLLSLSLPELQGSCWCFKCVHHMHVLFKQTLNMETVHLISTTN